MPATLLSGQSVLPQAKNTDIYLASLGVLLTAVYICGLIFHPKRQFLDLGTDSLVVLVLYTVGVVGLFIIVEGCDGYSDHPFLKKATQQEKS